MKELTPAQKKVLKAISEFRDQRGYPPSIRELCRILGLQSSSTVYQHLVALQKKGYVTRIPYSPRTLAIRAHPDGGNSP